MVVRVDLCHRVHVAYDPVVLYRQQPKCAFLLPQPASCVARGEALQNRSAHLLLKKAEEGPSKLLGLLDVR